MGGTERLVASVADSHPNHTVRWHIGTVALPSARLVLDFPLTPDIPLLPDWSKAEEDNFTLRFMLKGNSPGIPPVRRPAGAQFEPSEDMQLEMPARLAAFPTVSRNPGSCRQFPPAV